MKSAEVDGGHVSAAAKAVTATTESCRALRQRMAMVGRAGTWETGWQALVWIQQELGLKLRLMLKLLKAGAEPEGGSHGGWGDGASGSGCCV